MNLYKLFLAFLAMVFSFSVPNISTENNAQQVAYKNLGIPLSDYYTAGTRQLTVWDIAIEQNKLFVASGDYSQNAGPIQTVYYDMDNDIWITGEKLPEEQIERFLYIDGILSIPGTDPRENWSTGNYYTYENDTWIKHRNIPGGVHQFDMAEFDNKIFIGLGVTNGQFPIAVSDDNGQTFTQVPMYRDGVLLNTSDSANAQIRVYELFILNNELFALYYYYDGSTLERSFYRYENNGFTYCCDLSSKIKFYQATYEFFTSKLIYEDLLFFTTGNLYVTDDLTAFHKINLGENTIASDLKIIEDELYVLTNQKTNNGQYRISVWRLNLQQFSAFSELFYFEYPCLAQCFAYRDGQFYFGMGDGCKSDYNAENGTVLAASYNPFTA